MDILNASKILINQPTTDKVSAIKQSGQLLVDANDVTAEYIPSMIARDQLTSVFIGNGVAIPHGNADSSPLILRSGLSITQYRDGIDFDGNIAYLVIGIAGYNGTHMDILSKVAMACSDEENVQKIVNSDDPNEIMKLLNEAD